MVKLVVFDAFGTLVQSVTPVGPYFKLAKRLWPNDSFPLRHRMMTENRPFSSFVDEGGGDVAAQELQAQLHDEISALSLYMDVNPTIEELRYRGYEIAVCSNLAHDYGQPLRKLLPKVESFFFSYELGCLKPDPAIYLAITDRTGIAAAQTLFVGDSQRSDVDGPRSAGMHAGRIDRRSSDKNLLGQVEAHLNAIEAQAG